MWELFSESLVNKVARVATLTFTHWTVYYIPVKA